MDSVGRMCRRCWKCTVVRKEEEGLILGDFYLRCRLYLPSECIACNKLIFYSILIFSFSVDKGVSKYWQGTLNVLRLERLICFWPVIFNFLVCRYTEEVIFNRGIFFQTRGTVLGQRDGLSKKDVQKIQKMYKCNKKKRPSNDD